MIIASRTLEGFPSQCPLCGATTNLEHSDPTGDAPCPNCGHLLWRSTELLSQVQNTVTTLFGVPASELYADTTFVDQLDADSLDVVDLVMELEDETGITIPDDEYESIRTIGDAVRYFERHDHGR